jgi:DNA-binding transcriptional LysR family regulator
LAGTAVAVSRAGLADDTDAGAFVLRLIQANFPVVPMDHNVDLGDIRAFIAVAEFGAFHEAAQQLNISQPALSRRIQKLEETLGVGLLQRSTRRVELTTVGREFLPKARHVLNSLETALLSIGEIADRRFGQVNVACVPTAAYYFLPTVIKAFNIWFPKIRVRILDEGANEVLQSVINGDAELGLNLLGAQEPELEFEPLMQDPFVLACREDHPLASKREVEWRDLEPYPFISVGRQSGNRLILDIGLAHSQWRPKWFYEVQHLSTSLGLVEAGLGVAALPQMAMPRDPHPVLVSRRLVNPVITRTMGIIRRRDFPLSPGAQKFHDLLQAKWSSGVDPKIFPGLAGN